MRVTAFYCRATGKLVWSLQGEYKYPYLIARNQARLVGDIQAVRALNILNARCVVGEAI